MKIIAEIASKNGIKFRLIERPSVRKGTLYWMQHTTSKRSDDFMARWRLLLARRPPKTESKESMERRLIAAMHAFRDLADALPPEDQYFR